MITFNVVRTFFEQANLTQTCGVVALSGGPDSVVLAHVLVRLLEQGLFRRIVLAHVNHQLRGAESDADEAFVSRLGEQWQSDKLICLTTRIDVAGIAEDNKDNLEKTARELRYGWLAQVVHGEGAAWLATGHTADDQAETVLHRLLRGSGLQGLTAIASKRDLIRRAEHPEGPDGGMMGQASSLPHHPAPLEPRLAGPFLVRPLLGVRRADILAYLREQDQSFCQDSSNQDQRFTRNRLRMDLLPLLAEQYQPAIVDILCRLAGQAQAAQTEIVVLAQTLLGKAELPRAGPLLVFRAADLTAASTYLVCEMFRLVWQRENWPMNDMDHQAWLRLDELLRGRLDQHDFPGRIQARRRERVLQIGPGAH